MKQKLKKRLAEIFKKKMVDFAYLFGSQAKGRTGPLSDIDIAVYFDEKVPSNERFDTRMELLGELMDLFKTNDIDLVVLNDAPPLLSDRILKDGILIFSENDKIRLDYEVKTTLKYLDWKPYLTKYTEEIFGRDVADGR